MKQRSSKRAAVALAALLMAVCLFIGCTVRTERTEQAESTEDAAYTLYETSTLKIVRQGAKTDVYDLAGNSHYGFTKKRVRRDPDAQQIREVKTSTDTETIKIQLIGGGILVDDKTAGKTIYIP